MAYTNDYNFGSGYSTTYSGNYYGYQVGVIFAILIAGLLLLAICAAIIYFGCVKGMRHNDKQKRVDSFSTRARGTRAWQPTASYSQFGNEKIVPVEFPRAGYTPDQETPILQSSMHTQAAYIPHPPTYAAKPAYLQQQQQQPLERIYSRQQVIDNVHPRQVTIAETPYNTTAQSRTSSRHDGMSSTWKEIVTECSTPEQHVQRSSVVFHTSSV